MKCVTVAPLLALLAILASVGSIEGFIRPRHLLTASNGTDAYAAHTFLDPPRCAMSFKLLERTAPDGDRHSPLLSVFDAAGAAFPNGELRFNNDVYKDCASEGGAALGRNGLVGTHQGHCIVTWVNKMWECYFTWSFPTRGTIAAHGPLDLTALSGALSVTGGTGAYMGATGEVMVDFGSSSKCKVGNNTVNTYTWCLNV